MRFKKQQQDWAHLEKSVLLCCHHPPISQLGSHFSSSRFSLQYPVTIKNVARESNSKVDDTCQIFQNDIHETSQQYCHPKTHWSSKKCRKKRPKHSSHIFFLPKLCTKMNSSISGFYTQKWRNLRCSQHQQFRNAQYYTHKSRL